MNTKTLLANAILLAACFSAPAQATLINGTIGFGGVLQVTGGTDFASATGIDFQFASVLTTTGDYQLEGVPKPMLQSVAFTDFSFDGPGSVAFPVPPTSPLWTFTFNSKTFSFDLASISVDTHNASTLSLSGLGTLNITGYDATPGMWNLTTQPNGTDVDLTFSASSRSVPEPITLAMLGLGFASLARRKIQPIAI